MLLPDWSSTWTPREAEAELKGFVFKGPGIYHEATGDSILVIPVNRPSSMTWHQRWVEGEKFCFYVYNQRNISDVLNKLIGAPTRD